MTKIFLSLGSNQGDRMAHIRGTLELLSENISHVITSSIYKTEPLGNKNQPFFLNCVVEAQTELRPEQLLKEIKIIEKKLGRDVNSPDSSSQPRPIDIDILFYDDEIINQPTLAIPHPRLHLRKFVLVPLAEITPNLTHPILKKSVKELLNQCADTSIVRPHDDSGT